MLLATKYTLGPAWIWILLAALAGLLFGWLANGWRKTKWVDSSSSTVTSASSEELERLRGRVANLEPVVAERDTQRKRIMGLEAELRDCQAAKASAAANVQPLISGVEQSDHDLVVADRDRLRALVGEHESALSANNDRIAALEGQLAAAAVPAAAAGVAQADHDAVVAERDRLQGLVGQHEGEVGRLQGLVGDLEGRLAAPVSRFAGVNYDFERAQAVLGERIKMDDLKVVEGIGPKIEELCHGGGITTWAGLADTPVSRLQEILDAAGERFRIHNPATWPQQSELLAFGKWEEFKELTDRLTAGRD